MRKRGSGGGGNNSNFFPHTTFFLMVALENCCHAVKSHFFVNIYVYVFGGREVLGFFLFLYNKQLDFAIANGASS